MVTEQIKFTLKDAAKKLTGSKKRAFMAQVTTKRCWGVLEKYGHGAILDTVSSAINWASNMTWKGKHPTVYLIENVYHKGVTVPASELKSFQEFWHPSENLPQWDITIIPY